MDMIEVKEVGEVAIVTFIEPITIENIEKIYKRSLSEDVYGKTDKVKIVLNMTNVVFMNSLLIGKIVGLFKKIKDKNGVMAFTNLSKELSKSGQIFFFSRFADIYKTDEEAIEKLSQS